MPDLVEVTKTLNRSQVTWLVSSASAVVLAVFAAGTLAQRVYDNYRSNQLGDAQRQVVEYKADIRFLEQYASYLEHPNNKTLSNSLEDLVCAAWKRSQEEALHPRVSNDPDRFTITKAPQKIVHLTDGVTFTMPDAMSDAIHLRSDCKPQS